MPAPDAPTRNTASPGRISSEMPRSTSMRALADAEGPAQVVRADDRGSGVASGWRWRRAGRCRERKGTMAGCKRRGYDDGAGMIPSRLDSTAAALEELMQSPQLPDHVADLRAFLRRSSGGASSSSRRSMSRMKAEFINGEVSSIRPRGSRIRRSSIMRRRFAGSLSIRHDLGEVLVGKNSGSLPPQRLRAGHLLLPRRQNRGWDGDTMIFPPPDLIVEVLSPSTERNDRTIKFQDYAAHGVSEYWIIDADAQVIEQYIAPGSARPPTRCTPASRQRPAGQPDDPRLRRARRGAVRRRRKPAVLTALLRGV